MRTEEEYQDGDDALLSGDTSHCRRGRKAKQAATERQLRQYRRWGLLGSLFALVAVFAAGTAGLTTAGLTSARASTTGQVRRRSTTVSAQHVLEGPVILYGDSLAWEAQDSFRQALRIAGIREVSTETFGGTAICDWLPQMRRDAIIVHPRVVVVEFSGNAFTPCMRDSDGRPLSGPTYMARYRQDAATVLGIFHAVGTIVYLAGAPISRQAELTHSGGPLNQLYAALAATNLGVRYVDAGQTVLNHGRWTERLPCLPDEPCDRRPGSNRQNVVRAPDGAHFCPVGGAAARGVTGLCPVWSSGAYRYGLALATPVERALTQVSATRLVSPPIH